MSDETPYPFDAVLLLSFGGPEGPDDVVPFLENVTRGRGIPRERLIEVGQQYLRFGGVSPLNGQNRAMLAALEAELESDERTRGLPLYWANRNWKPFVEDTVARLASEGKRRVAVFVTSLFGSYSGCRQYQEDLVRARLSAGPGAPDLIKLRNAFDHPGFIEPMIESVCVSLNELGDDVSADGADAEAVLEQVRVVFSAHSLPLTQAESSPYERRLRYAAELIAEGVAVRTGRPCSFDLAFQSRSGPSTQPWLEPYVGDHVEALREVGVPGAIVVPLGFVSDHMEVVYDLDTVLGERFRAFRPGFWWKRAGSVGTDPRFVSMIRELIVEHVDAAAGRPVECLALSPEPAADPCAATCCPAPNRPTRPAAPLAGGR